MATLANDLTESDRHSLSELSQLAIRAIRETGINRTTHVEAAGRGLGHYWLLSFPGSPKKRVRPVNSRLFVFDPADLERLTDQLQNVMKHIAVKRDRNSARTTWRPFFDANGLARSLYTIQQAISIALDLLLPDNQARKRAGQYFEDLFSSILDLLDVSQRRINFRLPVPRLDGTTFNIEVDRVLNTRGSVRSTPTKIDPADLLVSLKTSSKDRFSKLFVDNTMAERITEMPMKLLAVFHNDIQRTRSDGVSVTFLAQQFLVYTEYLSRLSGVYYVDPPAHSVKDPWKRWLKPIDDLLLEDLWKL